jgi:hypothetical protein
MSVVKNSVSDRNSTRAPLAASGVFVGGMEDALHYDTVTVTIDADADATLIVQESTDGSYITSQEQFIYLTGSSMSFSKQLKTKYFNVRFVCGALPITTLQLQTIMRVSPAMPTSIEVTATDLDIRALSATTDGVEIFGLQGANKRAVVVDAAGHLQVDVRTMPAVTATNLDIRDLSETTDSVGAWGYDGSSLRRLLTDASGALQVDVLTAPTTTVNATALDIRALDVGDTVTVEPGAVPLSVTASALDIRALTAVDVVTIIQGGGLTVDLNSQLGGQNAFRVLSVVPTATQVSTGGLSLWSLSASNVNASACYLKLYDSATSVDETATPVMTLRIPPVTGQVDRDFVIPFLFVDGLWLRATTGVADNSTGAPAANDVIVNVGYQ